MNLSTGGTAYVNNSSDGELKDWFLECVKSVKRDVAQRKNNGEQLNF